MQVSGRLSRIHGEQSGVKDNKETNRLWTETLREEASVRAKL